MPTKKRAPDAFAKAATRWAHDPAREIIAAAASNDLEKLKYLVSIGTDINTFEDGDTPLTAAIQNGFKEIITWLLENGADINKPDGEKRTPLIVCAYAYHRDDLIQILINAHAKINERDDTGRTAMHYAAEGDKIETLKYLLAAKAITDLQDHEQYTPLHLACIYGHEEVASLLITAGTAINSKDNAGCTPLIHAAYNGYINIAAALITAGADVLAQDEDGATAQDHIRHKKNSPAHDMVASLLEKTIAQYESARLHKLCNVSLENDIKKIPRIKIKKTGGELSNG